MYNYFISKTVNHKTRQIEFSDKKQTVLTLQKGKFTKSLILSEFHTKRIQKTIIVIIWLSRINFQNYHTYEFLQKHQNVSKQKDIACRVLKNDHANIICTSSHYLYLHSTLSHIEIILRRQYRFVQRHNVAHLVLNVLTSISSSL